MSKWKDTDEAAIFIASADSKETDTRIMQAIAFFASDLDEAEAFWNGDFRSGRDLFHIFRHATNNGMLDAGDMQWGDQSLAFAFATYIEWARSYSMKAVA